MELVAPQWKWNMAFLYAKIVREPSKSPKVVSYSNKVVAGASSAGDIDRLTKKRVIADAKEAQVQVPDNKFCGFSLG